MTNLYKKLFVPVLAAATALTMYSCDNSDKIITAMNENTNKLVEHIDSCSATNTQTMTESVDKIVDQALYFVPLKAGEDTILYQGNVIVDSSAYDFIGSKEQMHKEIGFKGSSSSAKSSKKKTKRNYTGRKQTHRKQTHGTNHTNSSATNNTSSQYNGSNGTSTAQNQTSSLNVDSLNKLVNGVYKAKASEGADWLKVLARDGEYTKSNYKNN